MSLVRVFAALALASLVQSVGPAGAALNAFSISGFVWIDANANKLPSVWEPRLPGVVVKLMNPTTNAVLKTATTGASGNYVFSGITKGNYRLGFSIPPGYVATTPSVSLTLAANAVRNFGVTTPRSIEEKALNLFGDRWSLAKPNPSMQRAGGTGCYRQLTSGMRSTFTQEELQFIKRLAAQFYIEACSLILETTPPFSSPGVFPTSDRLRERVAQLKVADPSLKYITYQRMADWSLGQVGWIDIYLDHRDWFVYKKGTTSFEDVDIAKTPNGAPILDITNPAFQDYVAAHLAEALTYYNIDGFFIDGVLPTPFRGDLAAIPDSVTSNWQSGWIGLLTKVKAAVGPSRFIFASVPRNKLEFSQALIPLIDGILLEDTFSPVRYDVAARFALVQQTVDAAVAAGKWILTTENTKVDDSLFATTTAAKEHALQRYYLAAFYIFNKGKMLFYYNPPAAMTAQYGAEAFFTDWNIKVGVNKGPYVQIANHPGVYKRIFANAVVYLNTSASTFPIIVPAASQFKLDPDGNTITSYVMQPKSGFILSRAQAFQ